MSLEDGVFSYDKNNFEGSSEPWTTSSFSLSSFDKELRRKWDQAQDNGLFRYKLDIEDTKVFGENQYICQLNVKRATERRKPDAIMTVNQPFNPASFNFTKIKADEILFEMFKGGNSDEQLTNGYQEDLTDDNCSDSGKSCKQKRRNVVVINASPLEYGHVLLIPDIDACRPQILSEAAIEMAFESMLLSKHRGFRVGFNSLCALASVNHLHLHAYYLDKELFSESAPVVYVSGCLYEMKALPCKGFAFQLHGSTVNKLSRILYQIADYCVHNEIAHNFFMTRGPVFGEPRDSLQRTVRVYFWPRKKVIGMKDEAAFNVALVELAGHIPVKIRELYGILDKEYIEATIREVALEETEYSKIKDAVIKICDSCS